MKNKEVNFEIMKTIFNSIAIEYGWKVLNSKIQTELYYVQFSVDKRKGQYVNAPFKFHFGSIYVNEHMNTIEFNCHILQSDFEHFEDYYMKLALKKL